MIAEKTADMIRGRQLSPFEPPTRVATGGPRYPRPEFSYERLARVSHPPPAGQIFSDQLHRSYLDLANLTAQEQLARTTNGRDGLDRFHYEPSGESAPAAAPEVGPETTGALAEAADDEAAEENEQREEVSPGRRPIHEEFLLKNYAQSELASGLIKRMAPLK